MILFPIQQKTICGDPDFFLCINGIMVGLELKAGKKSKIAALQLFKLHQIEMHGGIGLIAHPDNWGETLEYITDLTSKPWKEKPECLKLPIKNYEIKAL